jgi:hypothetical protein
MKRTIALMLVAFFAGCMQMPSRVDTVRNDGPDKSYTVDLPVGWIKEARLDKTMLLASRNGYLLEIMQIVRRPLKDAFPKTKKAAGESMLPAELAELAIAEIKSEDQFTAALRVLENDPVEIAGQDGFHIRVSFKNARGLEIQRVVDGFTDKASYYQIAFQAPALYYFETYYPDFQKAVASFQLTTGNKKAASLGSSVVMVFPPEG